MGKYYKILFLFVLILFVFSNFALAKTTGDTSTDGFKNPFDDVDNFSDLLNKIVGYLIKIGAPILVLMVIIGGFQILFAGGNPEKVKTGGKTILWAAVGYAILLCSWGLIYIIKEVLGVKS